MVSKVHLKKHGFLLMHRHLRKKTKHLPLQTCCLVGVAAPFKLRTQNISIDVHRNSSTQHQQWERFIPNFWAMRMFHPQLWGNDNVYIPSFWATCCLERLAELLWVASHSGISGIGATIGGSKLQRWQYGIWEGK